MDSVLPAWQTSCIHSINAGRSAQHLVLTDSVLPAWQTSCIVLPQTASVLVQEDRRAEYGKQNGCELEACWSSSQCTPFKKHEKGQKTHKKQTQEYAKEERARATWEHQQKQIIMKRIPHRTRIGFRRAQRRSNPAFANTKQNKSINKITTRTLCSKENNIMTASVLGIDQNTNTEWNVNNVLRKSTHTHTKTRKLSTELTFTRAQENTLA